MVVTGIYFLQPLRFYKRVVALNHTSFYQSKILLQADYAARQWQGHSVIKIVGKKKSAQIMSGL